MIYKKGISITTKDFNIDSLDRWERPPWQANIISNNTTVTVFNIHIKPSDVSNEMTYLESLINDPINPMAENVIVMGDLNADCSYYNNAEETQFDSWTWVITDVVDTTVSNTDCAYDRVIMNFDFKGYGIYKEITPDMSDHYLIWVEI